MKNIVLQTTIMSVVDKIIQKNTFVKNILQDVVQAWGTLLLVGGSVRDSILGKEIKDLDFEIYKLDAATVQSILQKQGRLDIVGKSFGVFKLQGCNADFALPRTDGNGRKPIVHSDPFLSYEQAFVRRDLTMNAMGIDLHTKELIDIFGGMRDLENKILRAPDIHFFAQDPLRLFRVMQFAGRFEMSVDQTLSQACATMSLQGVAQERIYQEFFKVFTQSVHPSRGLRWLHDIGRWHDCFVESTDFEQMCQSIDAGAQVQDSEKKELLCWTILFLYTELYEYKQYADLKKTILRFVLQQKLTDAIIGLLKSYEQVHGAVTDFDIKMCAWHAQPHSLHDVVTLLRATQKRQQADAVQTLAQKNQVLHKPIAPVLDGQDIIPFVQGKQVGEFLRAAYEEQIRFSITDKQELLARIGLIEK